MTRSSDLHVGRVWRLVDAEHHSNHRTSHPINPTSTRVAFQAELPQSTEAKQSDATKNRPAQRCFPSATK